MLVIIYVVQHVALSLILSIGTKDCSDESPIKLFGVLLSCVDHLEGKKISVSLTR